MDKVVLIDGTIIENVEVNTNSWETIDIENYPTKGRTTRIPYSQIKSWER